MIKIIKEKATILRFVDEWVELRKGIDRLFLIVLFLFLFVHIGACLWYILVDLNRDDPNGWLFTFSFLDSEDFDVLKNIIIINNNFYQIFLYMSNK